MNKLSARTTHIVQKIFGARNRDLATRTEAERILREECGDDFPGLQDENEHQLERYHFAALKLSGGDLIRLREAAKLAKSDWRDLLVAAGFGSVTEHENWAKQFDAAEPQLKPKSSTR